MTLRYASVFREILAAAILLLESSFRAVIFVVSNGHLFYVDDTLEVRRQIDGFTQTSPGPVAIQN